jgi:putative FmdB family regulatory protein
VPIYEYECQKCGNQIEAWQKFSDPPLTKCELCNGKMKKVISQTTFHLKGTGWYVTDYASKSGPQTGMNQTKENKSDKKASSSSSSDDTKKSAEKKPSSDQ